MVDQGCNFNLLRAGVNAVGMKIVFAMYSAWVYASSKVIRSTKEVPSLAVEEYYWQSNFL